MTKGQNYAIHILVARDLGMKNVSYVDEAEKYIDTNKIQPVLIGSFAEESDRCVQWICSCDLVGTALNKADKYISKLQQ